MRFQLLVFDLDGTLIDSRADIAAAVNAALTDFNLPRQSEERIETMVGDGARELVQRAIGEPQGRSDEEFQRLTDAVLARYVVHYEAHPTTRTQLYPGVRDGLSRLAQMSPLLPLARVIATNKPGHLARRIASALSLSQLVDRVLGEGDVPRRKPDPAMLDEAMRGAGVTRDATLYVGDGPVDAHTAINAGVPLCMVSWGYRRGEALAKKPEFEVDRFEEIVELVLGS